MNAPICQGALYLSEEGDGPLCLQCFVPRPRMAWPRWASVLNWHLRRAAELPRRAGTPNRAAELLGSDYRGRGGQQILL